MNTKFKKTKAGVKICPFFGWQSENIEGAGQQEENDVSLSICSHEQNPNQCEGNCQESFCPLLHRREPKTAKEWQEKVEAHLAEYTSFASSQTYLFEAFNLIRQLESELEAKDKLLFAYESARVPDISRLRAELRAAKTEIETKNKRIKELENLPGVS